MMHETNGLEELEEQMTVSEMTVSAQTSLSTSSFTEQLSKMYERMQLTITYSISYRNTVPLYHFQSIFVHIFGPRIRLNWQECKYLRELTMDIFKVYKQFMVLHHRYNNTNESLEVNEVLDSLSQLLNYATLLCHKSRQFIGSMIYRHRGSSNHQVKPEEPENTTQGMNWLQEIVGIYKKIGGETPCTCSQFFKFLREHHTRLSDHELEVVTQTIESTLGQTSLNTIIKNLEHYLMMNWQDLLPPIQEAFQLQHVVSSSKPN
jgi:hypothetical protein